MMTQLLQQELHQLETDGLLRSLKSLHSPQGRTILLDGREVLNFSSNDYLGLANDDLLKKAAIEAISTYGFGSGASRLICGNMKPHEVLEKKIAELKNAPSALVFSSGYMANTGIIPALMNREGIVLSDRLNHASIIDGITLSRAKLLRYVHADMESLERMLQTLPAGKPKMIVTDSVFSMDGDKAPLGAIVELARRYEAMVMVDEAHGFGVLGKHGGGLVEELGLGDHIDIQMGTLSKAAGCLGGYVCGSKTLRDYLINKSRSFVYTTGMPPSLAAAAAIAVDIIREASLLRQRLYAHADYVRRALKAMGFDTMHSTTPIIPVLVKDPVQAKAMSQRLLDQGILLLAIRPPTVPQGTSRLRLTVTAAHTQEDLDKLLTALRTL